MEPQISSQPTVGDQAAAIVEALRSKFGSDALGVARLQEDASPEFAGLWSEVVSRLSA